MVPARRPGPSRFGTRWPAWLAGIGGQPTDPGNRIGQVRDVGGAPERPDVLASYIVISASSLEAAMAVAEGCPMLAQGGTVEVGEVIRGRSRQLTSHPVDPGPPRTSGLTEP